MNQKSLTVGEAFDVAVKCHSAGQPAAAAALCGDILRADPLHVGALCLLSFIRARSGDLDAAQALLRRAIAADPAHPHAYAQMGPISRRAGDLDRCVRGYRRALVLRGPDADTLYNLGNALSARGDLDAAADCYEGAARLTPTDREAWVSLVGTLRRMNRQAVAQRLLRTAREGLRHHPADRDLLKAIGTVHVNVLWAALAPFATALEVEETDPVALVSDAGNVAQASARIAQALAAAPDDPLLLCRQAAVLLHAGRHQEAEAVAHTALRLAPGSAEAHGTMAAACSRFRPNTALGYALAALALGGADAGATRGHLLRFLGYGCLYHGRKERALDWFRLSRDVGVPSDLHAEDVAVAFGEQGIAGGGLANAPAPAPPRAFMAAAGERSVHECALFLSRGFDADFLIASFEDTGQGGYLALDVPAVWGVLGHDGANHFVAHLCAALAPRAVFHTVGGITERNDVAAEFLPAIGRSVGGRIASFYSDAVKPFFRRDHWPVHRHAVRAGFAIDAGFAPEEAAAPGAGRAVNAWAPLDERRFRLGTEPRTIPVWFTGRTTEHYAERQEYIDHLARHGIAVQPVLMPDQRLSAEEYGTTLRAARICLNFCRAYMIGRYAWDAENAGLVHMKARVLEALASGCLLLEQENPVTARHFEPYVDYVPFRDPEDLVAKVRHYLSNEAERAAIAAHGHATWKARYTARHFWSMVWDTLGG